VDTAWDRTVGCGSDVDARTGGAAGARWEPSAGLPRVSRYAVATTWFSGIAVAVGTAVHAFAYGGVSTPGTLRPAATIGSPHTHGPDRRSRRGVGGGGGGSDVVHFLRWGQGRNPRALVRAVLVQVRRTQGLGPDR